MRLGITTSFIGHKVKLSPFADNDLTIQVDDEVKVFGDSAVLFDTFAMEGSQWKESNQVKVPAASDVLIIKVGNTVSAICNTVSRKFDID